MHSYYRLRRCVLLSPSRLTKTSDANAHRGRSSLPIRYRSRKQTAILGYLSSTSLILAVEVVCFRRERSCFKSQEFRTSSASQAAVHITLRRAISVLVSTISSGIPDLGLLLLSNSSIKQGLRSSSSGSVALIHAISMIAYCGFDSELDD